ncbi:MAG: META domain-containing protein [Ignavibacteria bacterium]|nr:META domain-containing protein [Ignavibacteria bacterium]
MKIIHGLLLICLCGLFALGCSSSDGTGDKSALTGTEWVLFEMDGVKYEPASGKSVTLKLDSKEKSVSGKAPCNTYGGPYTKSSNKLSFGGLYSTEMACDDLDKETIFFKQMQKAFAYQISGDKLYLFDSGGMVILRFKAK